MIHWTGDILYYTQFMNCWADVMIGNRPWGDWKACELIGRKRRIIPVWDIEISSLPISFWMLTMGCRLSIVMPGPRIWTSEKDVMVLWPLPLPSLAQILHLRSRHVTTRSSIVPLPSASSISIPVFWNRPHDHRHNVVVVILASGTVPHRTYGGYLSEGITRRNED